MKESLTADQENKIREFHILLKNAVTIEDIFPPEDGVGAVVAEIPPMHPAGECVGVGKLALAGVRD